MLATSGDYAVYKFAKKSIYKSFHILFLATNLLNNLSQNVKIVAEKCGREEVVLPGEGAIFGNRIGYGDMPGEHHTYIAGIGISRGRLNPTP